MQSRTWLKAVEVVPPLVNFTRSCY
jgi:hypothetical protein